MGTQGCRQSKGAKNVRKHCLGGGEEGRRGGGGEDEEEDSHEHLTAVKHHMFNASTLQLLL